MNNSSDSREPYTSSKQASTNQTRRAIFWLRFTVFQTVALIALLALPRTGHIGTLIVLVATGVGGAVLAALCILRGGRRRASAVLVALFAYVAIPMIVTYDTGIILARAVFFGISLLTGNLLGSKAIPVAVRITQGYERYLAGLTTGKNS